MPIHYRGFEMTFFSNFPADVPMLEMTRRQCAMYRALHYKEKTMTKCIPAKQFLGNHADFKDYDRAPADQCFSGAELEAMPPEQAAKVLGWALPIADPKTMSKPEMSFAAIGDAFLGVSPNQQDEILKKLTCIDPTTGGDPCFNYKGQLRKYVVEDPHGARGKTLFKEAEAAFKTLNTADQFAVGLLIEKYTSVPITQLSWAQLKLLHEHLGDLHAMSGNIQVAIEKYQLAGKQKKAAALKVELASQKAPIAEPTATTAALTDTKLTSKQENLSSAAKAWSEGDYKKALEYYQNAEALDPNDTWITTQIKVVQEKLVQQAKAVEPENDPKELAKQFVQYGMTQFKDGKYELAIKAFLKAKELAPSDSWIDKYIGKCNEHLKEQP